MVRGSNVAKIHYIKWHKTWHTLSTYDPITQKRCPLLVTTSLGQAVCNSRNTDKMKIPKSAVTLEYCISLIQGGPKHPDNFSNLHNSSLNFQDTDFSFSFILSNSTVLFTYIENFFFPSGLNMKLQGFRYSTEKQNLFKLICGFIWIFQIYMSKFLTFWWNKSF